MYTQLQSIKCFITATLVMAGLIMASGCTVSVGIVSAVMMEDVVEAKIAAKPVLKLVRRGHDVVFFSGESALSVLERKRLDTFLFTFNSQSMDGVFLIMERDGAGGDLSGQRMAEVSEFLESRGRFVTSPPSGYRSDSLPGGSVKVVLQSLETYPSKRPEWFSGPGRNFAIVEGAMTNVVDMSGEMVASRRN